ncbi:hypothetical protein CPB83DRAFT_896712 [Crepidotus variabilis]|uniref:Uncharacterized protein n=1 Tax=Crepidotus variabilis TaxID=179855 RepID=A0A9P6EB61_9AGAR|nr:hypothetical protein CPB83DRAFT_896712 [Crepidotus variabilis]
MYDARILQLQEDISKAMVDPTSWANALVAKYNEQLFDLVQELDKVGYGPAAIDDFIAFQDEIQMTGIVENWERLVGLVRDWNLPRLAGVVKMLHMTEEGGQSAVQREINANQKCKMASGQENAYKTLTGKKREASEERHGESTAPAVSGGAMDAPQKRQRTGSASNLDPNAMSAEPAPTLGFNGSHRSRATFRNTDEDTDGDASDSSSSGGTAPLVTKVNKAASLDKRNKIYEGYDRERRLSGLTIEEYEKEDNEEAIERAEATAMGKVYAAAATTRGSSNAGAATKRKKAARQRAAKEADMMPTKAKAAVEPAASVNTWIPKTWSTAAIEGWDWVTEFATKRLNVHTTREPQWQANHIDLLAGATPAETQRIDYASLLDKLPPAVPVMLLELGLLRDQQLSFVADIEGLGNLIDGQTNELAAFQGELNEVETEMALARRDIASRGAAHRRSNDTINQKLDALLATVAKAPMQSPLPQSRVVRFDAGPH